MPPRRHDRDGNLFRVGWVYELHGHKLELLKLRELEGTGDFILVEDYGAMKKGKKLNLHLGNNYYPLYPGASMSKNNKAAAMFLEQEY
jgi:hypothetical protein